LTRVTNIPAAVRSTFLARFSIGVCSTIPRLCEV
jgi:hypothetical protein